MSDYKHTNALIHESSPYLLQHAHNPVQWMPWNKDTLALAKKADKMLLISIGYSACHWCHVMEHECFEDEEVAALMNSLFIPVKVDREERPDIDHIYMNAMHLTGKNGGWPLNFFALPDGRPFWGGTYFPKKQWLSVLDQVSRTFKDKRAEVEKHASKLKGGLHKLSDVPMDKDSSPFSDALLQDTVFNWKKLFDMEWGGRISEHNKFPLPNNYEFLLNYAVVYKDEEVLKHVKLTLDKVMYGAIQDHVGGGFARYSVDKFWKVPHFEKMLYDNAQLLSLYAKAFKSFKDEEYKETCYKLFGFVNRELLDGTGMYYSALDADSEGVEGKHYVWTENELNSILDEKEKEVIYRSYNIGGFGYWEDENNVLIRTKNYGDVANELGMNFSEYEGIRLKALDKLFKKRDLRIRPGLDDKCLTGWNALMISGLTDAYEAFGDNAFLQSAISAGEALVKNILKGEEVYRSFKKGKASISGFLEDYANLINAFTRLYECTFDQAWIHRAENIAELTISKFYDHEKGLFFFTSNIGEQLISKTIELQDNVIPSSNSVMAKALFRLGHIIANDDYIEKASATLSLIQEQIPQYGPSYSNWLQLYMYHTKPFYELAIVGIESEKMRNECASKLFPNKVLLGSENESDLKLLKNKFKEGETLLYVCHDKTCEAPANNTESFFKKIEP